MANSAPRRAPSASTRRATPPRRSPSSARGAPRRQGRRDRRLAGRRGGPARRRRAAAGRGDGAPRRLSGPAHRDRQPPRPRRHAARSLISASPCSSYQSWLALRRRPGPDRADRRHKPLPGPRPDRRRHRRPRHPRRGFPGPLRRRPGPKSLWLVEGTDHIATSILWTDDYRARVRRVFAESLGDRAAGRRSLRRSRRAGRTASGSRARSPPARRDQRDAA